MIITSNTSSDCVLRKQYCFIQLQRLKHSQKVRQNCSTRVNHLSTFIAIITVQIEN